MFHNEKLIQLMEMLDSNLVSKRKAGIKMAAEMLAEDLYGNDVRALLEKLSKDDLIVAVRKAAEDVLDSYKYHHTSMAIHPPDYIFGARCPKEHVSYYDKREYCPKNSNIVRRTTFRDARNVDEILLRCKATGCNERFYVEIDCEGYK